MAESSVNSSNTYRLGQLSFSIRNCNQSFLRLADVLIPHAASETDDFVTIDTGCETNIQELFAHLVKQHYKCIWIEGSCLQSPSGETVLITGRRGSGKTTLSASLAVGFGWRLIAEQFVLIDPLSNKIVSFPLPFFLSSSVSEQLSLVLDSLPTLISVEDIWYMKAPVVSADVDVKFDRIVFLDGWKPLLWVRNAGPGDCIRKLITVSNLIAKEGAAELLMESVKDAECQIVRGGTLSERIQFIQACADNRTKEYEPKTQET